MLVARNECVVPVELTALSEKTISVDYATQDNGAVAGEDYVATSGTLTFTGVTTNFAQTISIPIFGNDLDEPDEAFSVVLSGGTNVVLPSRTLVIKILDDDEPALPVNVNIGGGVTPIITPLPSCNGGSTLSLLMFQTKSLSLSEGGSATYQVRATSSQERNGGQPRNGAFWNHHRSQQIVFQPNQLANLSNRDRDRQRRRGGQRRAYGIRYRAAAVLSP